MKVWLNGLIAVLVPIAAAFGTTSDPPWKEIARHALGGVGGWDLLAVEPNSRRVFITRGDHLMIADLDKGKLVGDLPGLKRAHGVALVPTKNRGYVSSGGDDRVVAFDLTTLKPMADIPTGKSPDAMLYDSASGHVFVFNGHGNDASVIDPATDKVVATIAMPGKPELAVSDGHGKVFVNLEDKNQIAQIDVKTNHVLGTWTLGGCEEPSGLAIDAAHQRLFSVCANKKMTVLDAASGRVVATVAIGDGPDGAAFDAVSANAFSSNSDGTLTVVHEDDPDHFHVLATVTTPPRSRTITLDEKTHHVILPMAEFGETPVATPAEPHPRPPMKADTFGLLVIGNG